MSTRTWQQWSCSVRLVVGQDAAVPDAVMERAASVVAELMAEVDRAVSRFRVDSQLEAVNDASPRLVPVDGLTLTLVDTALEAARRTDGAVDPTVGGQLVAWGYDADIDVVRRGDAARCARPAAEAPADWRRVRIDRELRRIGAPRGLRLDLGATAKAWTADEAARRVASRSGHPTLVEIGGDVAVAGRAEGPWAVRVAEIADGPAEVVGLTHGGLATSSTVARRWRTEAGAAHHLIDPRTGAPVQGGLRSATVWASSCVRANTYSTAALVWGEAAPAKLGYAGVSARLVGADGTIRRTGGWPTEERVA